MRMILALATVSLAVLLSTAPLLAHHSFSATYDGNKPITLRGTIVKMGWQNPHAHLYVDVKNADGKVVTWEVDSAGPTTLMKQGLRKEDFVGACQKPGANLPRYSPQPRVSHRLHCRTEVTSAAATQRPWVL